ncbi:hypothetical protein ACQCLI_12770 [Pseudomonas nitroreducens]|uniref:hypothetical protein n=1 Tax=Pseudomonas nitroreducens TaxID=46680 RepID=UPI003CFFFB35
MSKLTYGFFGVFVLVMGALIGQRWISDNSNSSSANSLQPATVGQKESASNVDITKPGSKASIRKSSDSGLEYKRLEEAALDFDEKISEENSISTGEPNGLNFLERIADPKYSSKKLSEQFVDEGGLNKVSDLHGVRIVKMSLIFNDDGSLHVADLIADDSAFPKGIRKSLSAICKVSDDAWEINNDKVGSNKSGTVDFGDINCFYAGGENSYEILITKNSGKQ